MVCDTRLRERQTLAQRKEEVKKTIDSLTRQLAAGRAKVVIDKRTGAFGLIGFSDQERNGVSDACIYRSIMSGNNAMAKVIIARAEALAGRKIDGGVVGSGLHTHDGGRSWSKH